MKASDIPDAKFLKVVDTLYWLNETLLGAKGAWVMRWEVEPYFPEVPEKVLLAKARKLMKRGLLNGCPCGCRGDYEVTESGIALIKGEQK